MLIPSIDLLNGKVVQLVHGEKKALEFDSLEPWIERFSNFPIVQLIDLDAAMHTPFGNNSDLVHQIASLLPVQVGGGIRTPQHARSLLNSGVQKVIIGSSLFRSGGADLEVVRSFHNEVGVDRLIFAVDSKGGKVAVSGWKNTTLLSPEEAIHQLAPYCGAFLYTHIETEGTLQGFPIEMADRLRTCSTRRLIVAGGVRSLDEVRALDHLAVDTVVGMAIYSGLVPLSL
jgi:phosphoribosylformimino-5-aminoimidazole carboxamide ribotide isomerase